MAPYLYWILTRSNHPRSVMDPWNIRTGDVRPADSLPVFIIFCEDVVSEPVYVKYFETPSFKVNPVKCKKSKMNNVLLALTHCISQDMMEERAGELVLKSGDIQV